jgi:hypothetical protein
MKMNGWFATKRSQGDESYWSEHLSAIVSNTFKPIVKVILDTLLLQLSSSTALIDESKPRRMLLPTKILQILLFPEESHKKTQILSPPRILPVSIRKKRGASARLVL